MKKLLCLLAILLWSSPSAAEVAPGATTTIQVRGDQNFAPFEYLDEKGIPAGFDVDILRAVAEVMQLDIELRLGRWDEVRRDLEAGRIDALAGMRYSEERDLSVDFSAPYLINTSAIFVRKDSAIDSLDDLKGKEVALQRGDIMDDYLRELNLEANIVFVGNQTEALRRLADGAYDAVLGSRLRGLYLVSRLQLDNLTTAGQQLASGPYGFAVAEGDTELLAKLNEGLRILKATDRYDAIYQKWFGLYEKQSFYRDLLTHAAWVLTPILLLLLAATLWSWSLKRQVAIKTEQLEEQFAKRRQAETHLESERRFRQLVEASPVPMATIARDQRVLYVNHRFVERFGYTLEALSAAADWQALVTPGQDLLRTTLQAWNDQQPVPATPIPASDPLEVTLTCADGSLRHVVCSHAAIDDRHVLVFNDITKRKRVEKALEDRVRIEAMISSISTRFVNLAPEEVDREIGRALQRIGREIGVDRCYVFKFDADGTSMSNTHEWCEKGVASHRERLQKVPFDDFAWYLGKLRDQGLFYCPSVAALGPEAQSEKEEWLREGIKSLITVPMLLKGTMVGFIGFDAVRAEQRFSEEILFLLRLVGESFANALERRRVEGKLRAAHQRLQDIIDFLPDATFVVDRDGKVMAWNRAIEAMTGLFKEQMLGRGDYIYSVPFYGERRPTLIDLIRYPETRRNEDYAVLRQENQSLIAEQHLPALFGGKGAYVWAKASPLYDRNDKLAGAIESIRDISDRQAAQEKLEASTREMETFVYTVSHDLRTPLTPIIGYAEFLMDEYRQEFDGRALGCLKEIAEAGHRMLMLMEDLLALARVGQLESPDLAVDAGTVVREVLDALAAEIQRTGARVEVTELPQIKLPRTLLYQLFSNLIGNAIHYAGHQGSPIEVGGDCSEGVLRLFVRDHGPGIPAGEREQIFEPFYRGSAGRSSTGTGVGLATVAKIARLYGGSVRVEETPGGGATFRVEMREDAICRSQES